MASQRPPAWFRLSSMRAPAPALAPAPVRPAAPVRPPVPAPAIVRPAIPIRPPPPPPPTQPQEPPPVAPPSLPPPPPAPAPTATPIAAPRSPVLKSSPVAAQRSPVSALAPTPVSPVPPPVSVAAPTAPRSPVVSQPSPQRASVAAPRTPPPPSSPVTKATLTTSTNIQQSSPPLSTSPPPQRKMQLSPSSSNPTSPTLPKHYATPNAKAAATPEPSPKIDKPWENSPAQSPPPVIKPLANPPSPLSLPPPQIKTFEPRIDQKNVLVQESIDKPMKTHNPHSNGVAPKGKREAPAKDKGTSKKLSDSEESGMRVITIAGDNKGAVMEISSARKKNQQLPGNPHVLNKNGAEEGKSNNKEKSEKATTMQSTFLNSNVQGINNSIVFNTKCHHNDPGIHLTRLAKPNKD